jgi:hypothetical protein
MKTLPQSFAANLALRVGLGLLAAALAAQVAASDAPAQSPGAPVHADSREAVPSDEARQLADWILDSNNNRGLPFLVIDKKQAMVFAFHPDGRLRGMAPALLGMAIGDDSAPGIGERKLADIRPSERTTPAGRFVAALDHNLHGVEILWVDYDAAISLHRVVKGTPQERRAERLASPSALDNRISFGCINVPPAFFDQVVKPAFTGTNGIVYVLPETRSAQAVFGSYDVAQHRAAAQAAAAAIPVAITGS